MLRRGLLAPWGRALLLLLLALLALEAGLRLAGGFLLWKQASRNSAASREEGVRIVALGESTTADPPGGATQAWPRLLESLLRAQGIHARVFNEGLTGAHSALLLARMESVLSEDRPQIVIAMMGVNDHGKLGFRRAGLVTGTSPGVFSSLRVVKLVRLFLHWRELQRGSGHPPPAAPPPPHLAEAIRLAGKGEIPAARELLERDLAASTPLARALAFRALADSITPPLGQGVSGDKFLPAYELHRESVRSFLLPEEAELFALLALFLGRTEDCRALAREYLDRSLRPSLQTIGRLSDCGEKELPEARKLRETYLPGLVVFDKESAGEIRGNYRQLHEILKARQTCLIAMQYPLWPLAGLQAYFSGEEIRAGAESGLLSFAGNEENFRVALRDLPYEALFVDRFAGDFGHTNPLGHKLIAESAAKAVAALVRSGKCWAGW